LETNHEVYTAEVLAIKNELTEATEHLKLAYEILEQDQTEKETLDLPIQTITCCFDNNFNIYNIHCTEEMIIVHK
jgi:hypothetical protein